MSIISIPVIPTDGAEPFKIGEPISMDNPLPVQVAGDGEFTVGEPVSEDNPLPVQVASGSLSAALRASTSTFLASISVGALIATLTDPYGSGSTYTVVGTLPGQLALNGNQVVKGSAAATPGVSYTGKFRAVSSDGKHAVEETLTFDAVDVLPVAPDAPNLTVTSGDAQAVISWVDGANGGAPITGHKLYRGTTAGGPKTLVASPTTSPYVDTGLVNGFTYYYAIAAVNSVGEGARSTEKSASPVHIPVPTLQLGSDVSATEGNSGTTTVTVNAAVNRDGAVGPLTVNLSYAGTATRNTDFTAPSTATILAGQNSVTAEVVIAGDLVDESDETIIVTATLAAHPGATDSQTITITDDDVTAGPGFTAEIWASRGDSTWEGLPNSTEPAAGAPGSATNYGRGAEDTNWPNVFEVKLNGSISADTSPMDRLYAVADSPDRLCPQEYMGKAIQEATGRKIYLIQGAVGGSSIGMADSAWKVGNFNHEQLIERTNAGIRAVLAVEPGAKFMGFTQELGSNFDPYATLKSNELLAIPDLHARVTMNGEVGGTPATGNIVHLFIPPTPEYLKINENLKLIDWAYRDVAAAIPGGRYLFPPIGYSDGQHNRSPGIRALGTLAGQALSGTAAPVFTVSNESIGAYDPLNQELIGDTDSVLWSVGGTHGALVEVVREHRSTGWGGGDIQASRTRHYLRWKSGVAQPTGTYQITVTGKGPTGATLTLPLSVTVGIATLTSPTDAANGPNAAIATVSSAIGSGTLHWAVSTSAAPPSAAALTAGTGMTVAGSQAVVATGVQTVNATGLSAETTYYVHMLHERTDGRLSAIVSGDGFTTPAIPASNFLAYHDPSDKPNAAKAWGNLGTTTGDGTTGGGIAITGTGGYTNGRMRVGGASIPPTWSNGLVNVGTPNVKYRQTVKVGPTWPGFIYAAVGHNGKTAATGGDDQNQATYGVRMGTDGSCGLMDPAGGVSFGTFPALTVGNTYTLGIDVDQEANTATFYVDGEPVVGPVSPPGRTIPANTHVGFGGMYYDTGFEFGLLTVEPLSA